MEELGGGTPAREAGAAAREVDLSLLLDGVQEAFARVALDGSVEFVSAGARSVYGREPDELIGTQALDLVDPVDHAEVARRLERLGETEGGEERMTVRVRRPDGTTAWADSTARSVRDPATGELFIAIVAREATERVETQDALSRVDERFRELVEWVPAVVYEAAPGPEGVFHYVSPQIEEMLGYTPAEWLADPRLWFECIHPDDRGWMLELEREQEEQSRESDRRLASEYRMLHRNGRTVWVRDIARICEAEGDRVYWRGVLSDITAERNAQQSLADAHGRYRAIAEGLPACAYRAEAGVHGRWEFVSGQIEQLVGYRPEEVIADPTLWWACIHADDRERVEQAEERLAEMPSESEFVHEYRLRTRTGKVIWIRDRATVSRDAQSRLMMEGVITDISAERAAEGGSLGLADVYRLSCGDCGATWAAERIERCRQCQSQNVEGVSLNAALNDLAASRQQVEGLLDGIQRHLDALGTNLRSGSAQLSADDPAERTQ